MAIRNLGRAILVMALLSGSWDAGAALFRSYLSVAGNDANPCTLPLPCRLLPAALAAVNDGGEIWMLDSANFNAGPVAIDKSVTILAIPGALGSVVANGGHAIAVASPLAKVTLRNLVILNLAGTANFGVHFTSGTALTVEGCELYGLNAGIRIEAAGAVVTIKDTTIRDNTAHGIQLIGAMKATLRNVSLLNNFVSGLSADNGAVASLVSSAASGNGTGVSLLSGSGTASKVAISATAVTGNVNGIQVQALNGTATPEAMLNATTLSQNGTAVLIVGPTASVSTRQNNAFKFNTVDVSGGTLTVLAGQ